MTVDAGGHAAIAGTAVVGDQAGSEGSLDLAGGGTMTVGGQDVHGSGLIVGNVAGSTGAVTVGGTGSALVVDAGTQIGNAGTGSLSVLDGGHASLGLTQDYSEILIGLGYYGWTAGSDQGSGSLIVDGAGSILDYAGGLNVFDGAVTVRNSGQLDSHSRGDAHWIDLIGWGLPATPGVESSGLYGTATVTIEGAGSAWNSVNNLHMGDGGNGRLSILDGGKATFTGFANLGGISYLYDAVTGMPIPGLAGRTGSGTVIVSGAGSALTMVAAPWGAGTIDVGITGHGMLVVSNGGVVTAPGGIRVGGPNQSSVVIDGGLAGPGSIVAPSIALLDPSSRLVFVHGAASYDFAPVISGNGTIDVASGFTRLTGDSSAFAGHTTIDSDATLSVNGSLGGDISVNGRLQGSGTVGNVIVNDGGTLAPGNSPGTLHVGGDLVMQTGSTYEAEIDSDTGAADSIQVNGNVTIQTGTTLSVSNLGTQPLTPGTSLQLIQTVGDTSTVDGHFDSVVGGSELLDFGVSYEGGQIQVSAERSKTTNFATLAGAGFGSLGVALDAIPDDSALTRLLFAQVTTAAAAAALMDDMAGTMHADLRRVMLEDSRYARAAIGDRLRDDDASGGVAWARATGGSASADGDGALPGATVDRGGLMVGYDTAVGNSRLGVAIAAGKGSYAADGRDATANLYDRHVALYGRSTAGALRLGYGVAFGSTDITASRDFAIGSAAQHLDSRRDARTTQAFLDTAYRIDGGNSFRYLEPFLNLAHVRVQDDDVTETGSVAALAIEGGTTSATLGTLGLRWSADMGSADFAGSIGWRHAFGLDQASSRQAFVAGGPAFAIDSLPIADAVLVELGVKARMSPRTRVWFGYDGMFAGSAQDNGVKLQFNIDL
jgi:outer membrane autotransporter protein